MFWIILGAFIALSSGLLALSIVRTRLRRYVFPRITDNQIELIRMGLLLTGVAIGVFKGIESSISSNKSRIELESTKEELIKTKEELEKSNKKFKEFKEKASDRTIKKDIRNQIIEKLAPVNGEAIQIASVFGDEEAERFARDINDIFEKAGWEVKPFTRNVFIGGPVQNVTVLINNMEYAPIAHHIVSTFMNFVQFNEPPILLKPETEQKESIRINVGTKTIPD